MSNDVQSHEELAEGVAAEDRRTGLRHAARSLGSVTARIIGGSQVDLVNFSSRGVLFECDSRLLIGARASVRITTPDANLIVTGRVVRSRVKGLVDGALRYDAALALDTELALAPAVLAAALPAAAEDDLVAFESDFDPSFDPSPVEAYLAESEASLLEVAHDDLPLSLAAVAEQASPVVEAIPGEPAAVPAPALETPPAMETGSVIEPATLEADGEIAFEPAVEFAFDELGDPSFDAADGAFETAVSAGPTDPDTIEAVEPAAALIVDPIVTEEPAGTSMFDATYIPPVYESQTSESQFHVTPPMAAPAAAASSFFDARPSETYGEAPADAVVEAAIAIDGVLAADAANAIDFESDVAFEAVEMADFDPSVDPAPDAAPIVDDAPSADVLDASTPEAASDAVLQPPAAPPDVEDRVLLQFAATVPHDLAELRRIAADNQW